MNKTKISYNLETTNSENHLESKLSNIQKNTPENEILKIKPEINQQTYISNKLSSKYFITTIMWFILITGFLFGVTYIYLGGEKSLDTINDWLDKTLQNKSNTTLTNIFLSNIISPNIYIIIIFILGFSPISSLVISFILFLKGLGLGLNITFVFINYGWRGIIYEAIINVPFNIIIMYIIILSARETLKFSYKIYNIIKNKTTANTYINLNQYIIKFLLIFLYLAIILFFYSVSDFVFFNYFNIL